MCQLACFWSRYSQIYAFTDSPLSRASLGTQTPELLHLDKRQTHEVKSVKAPNWGQMKEGDKAKGQLEVYLNKVSVDECCLGA